MPIAPKVSVILTSYNHQKYIRESIESVLNQTYKDFELIIWDDASTDNSWEVISSYMNERIRVFRNETNQFMSYFRKAVSEVAQGEYIAIHHSGDVWEANKLERQVAFLDAHPEIGAVYSKVSIIGENGAPFEEESHFYFNIFDQPNRTRHEWLNHFFYHGNALCHPSVLIRKACYEDCGPYRHGFGQANDFDMWVRLCLKYDIHVLQEKLVRFRVQSNETNTSGFRPETHIRGEFELLQILNNFRAIETAEDFLKIFPQAAEYFKPQGYDIGFALGMVALGRVSTNYAKLFGLQLLFEALDNPDRARKIRELYNFGHNEFIALTAANDVFSVELIPNLSARLAEKEHDNQALVEQLRRRNLSMPRRLAESLILRLHPLRLRIAPQGGKREKLLKMVIQGLRIWKNEGLMSAYRKAIQKILGWLPARDPHKTLSAIPDRAQKERLAASPLDLRAIPKVQSVPSSYDVVILTGTAWQLRFQRPQQIARRFVMDGHRVFYISATFKKGDKTKVRPNEDGVFEVQLSGSQLIDIYSDPVSAQMMGAIHAAFDSLRNEFGIVDAVCILDLPFWKSVAFSLRDRFGWRVIYDCINHTARSDDASEKKLEEESLIQNSDLVLASSHSSFKELEKHNPNCLLVPTAADTSHFGQVPDQVEQRPDFDAHDTWEDQYAQIKQRIPSLFPQASIIIVSYNNVEYTQLCLKSIYEKTIYPNFEVIVVDNASNDGTPEFLRSFKSEHENIHIIYNSKNEGFARANNQGIALAQGDYIVLLNNDTVVTRLWLSRLINHLSDQRVGLVGPVTNGVSNEAYVEMTFTDIAALDAFATKLAKDRSNILTPIKLLAMYCMAGRRDVFQQVGPLDEQFGIGMFEDDDYSVRIRQAGYRIVVAEDVFIHHFGRAGFKILGHDHYLAVFEENRNKFEAKWNIKWEQHVSGTLAENRRLTAELQDILNAYSDARGVVIFPPTIGWNITLFQRPHQLARTFAKKGYLVFFCTEAQVDDLKGFKQVSHGLYLANIPWAVFDLVERPVLFALPYNREYVFQLRQPLIVYEMIDDLDVFPGDKIQLQKSHEILLKDADVVLVTADRLMDQVKQIRTDAIMCPNAVELDHFSEARGDDSRSIPPDLASIIKTDRPVIGYYGALAHWFDYDLVRQAAQKHSDWDFVLIGPNHDNTLMESNILSIPNIHWLGARDYSKLPDYLRHFTVATIPFLVNNITSATSPIKLFEYMAAGKPIVTSDMPECRKYPGVFVAHNTKEFIAYLEHALTLITDPVYIQQLYQTAEENTWESRVKQIIDALELHQNHTSLQSATRMSDMRI